jgi:hypothetical protein
MILYIVAVVVVLLTLAAISLRSLLQTEQEATLIRGDELQIGLVARSGVDYVSSTLLPPSLYDAADETLAANANDNIASVFISDFAASQQDGSTTSSRAVNLDNNPPYFAGIGVVAARPNRPQAGVARFTILSPRIEDERVTGIRYGLTNESARLHLGAVMAWEQDSPGQGSRSLMKLPGMTPSMADSILDWIDSDKTPRPSGAELDYYEQSGLQYAPRNAVPVALEELLLVREVTRKMLYGDDEAMTFGYNKTGRKDGANVTDNTVGGSTNGAGEPPAWALLLTTLSTEKLVDTKTGLVKIWLNEPDLAFLHQQLTEQLDKDTADFVVLFRQSPKVTVENVDTSLPSTRKIITPLELLDVTVAGHKSPFSLDGADAEEQFLKLLDTATEYEESIVYGRININAAPLCVLEAIPGMTTEAVSQIAARRVKVDESGRYQRRQQHPTWLAAEGIVDLPTLSQLWHNITCGGDVWRGQVVAFYDGKGPAARLEFVIDTTMKPPRQVYQKNLTLYGIGFPTIILKPN